jgi:transposase
MLKNKLHGEAVLGNQRKAVVMSLSHGLKQLQKEIKNVETKLFILVKLAHQDLLTRLKTIAGIGPEAAIILVILTRGFILRTLIYSLVSFRLVVYFFHTIDRNYSCHQ